MRKKKEHDRLEGYLSQKRSQAVTRLENLYNSQYVGGIGVGTKSMEEVVGASTYFSRGFYL